MRNGALCLTAILAFGGMLLAPTPGSAQYPVLAKFDHNQTTTLEGIVTWVDWRTPNVHVMVLVEDENGDTVRWAVATDSAFTLARSGWNRETLVPGDPVRVEGMPARDGSPQVWGNEIVNTATGLRVLYAEPREPFRPIEARPTPRWDNGQPILAIRPGGPDGYWALPTKTYLVEDGVEVDMVDGSGILRDLSDVSRVAPLQPWAEALYAYRQSRYLQDDPMRLNCKPPGGPRQFQLPYGIQFVEDHDRERIFVLIGSGNRNHRIIYNDGRPFTGAVGGDDDNPLYYGRARGEWDGDTLVVESRGFNEDFWFSNGGLPHTSHLRLVERFTRVDHDTLEYEVTIDDPGAYTRPWTVSWQLHWVSGEDLPFFLCQDNRP